MTPDLRVLIVSDNLLTRAGLAALLDTQDDILVVGQITTGTLPEELALYRADMIVCDLGWQANDSIETLSQIDNKDIPILVLLTDENDSASLLNILNQFPVYGLLLNENDSDMLMIALQTVANGLIVIDPNLSSYIATSSPITETITEDLLGKSRSKSNQIGAFLNSENINLNLLDKTNYGANWYSNEVEDKESEIIEISTTKGELEAKIASAKSGDIIALSPGKYTVSSSIVINKTITIQSLGNKKAEIVFEGVANTPAFELNPYGKLTLKNIKIKGNNINYAFASLKENMSNHFGLNVIDSEISNFNYALKVYKQSFSEEITFKNTSISNCENGIELSEETNDRGDYNTEYLTIDNCQFTNVNQNVVDYYRGGYDESTIGGNLLVTNSTFTNCGAKEKNKMLLNHRGIVNVNINNNTFKNNKVQFVSILWGAKNNIESNNTLSNSGKIKTEENLVMKLMY